MMVNGINKATKVMEKVPRMDTNHRSKNPMTDGGVLGSTTENEGNCGLG